MLTLLLFCLLKNTSSVPIVNGNSKPTRPNVGEFPFHASLMQKIQGKYHSFCGGSLIHPKWILTAAHCIQEDKYSKALRARDIYVALGSIYRNAQNAQILHVKKTKMYPNYLQTDRNDIALLELKNYAKLNGNVNLIRLQIDTGSVLGKTAFLTGFGVTNDAMQTPRRLRKATLHISDYRKCSNRVKFRKTEVCAVSSIAEGKACDGDSGGPLFLIESKIPIQIGITSYLSRSAKCSLVNNNSVYTRVSAFISWISKVTKINYKVYNQS